MTGSRESVLGVRWEQALEGFRTQMPVRFQTAEEDVWINAVVVEIGDDGLATSIEQVLEPAPAAEAGYSTPACLPSGISIRARM